MSALLAKLHAFLLWITNRGYHPERHYMRGERPDRRGDADRKTADAAGEALGRRRIWI